jgi:hypothetical protein
MLEPVANGQEVATEEEWLEKQLQLEHPPDIENQP